jgi:alpha-tubulin suppressor-like RCC1 family protein
MLLTLLAGCGGGDDGGASQQQPPPPPPPPTSVTQSIGPAGGTLNGPNGVVLTIPPDALFADTAITIAIDGTGAPTLPGGGQTLGQLISITPHGTTFGVPATLGVPFDPAQLPSGEEPVLLKTNARGDGWQQLAAVHTGNTLTAAATGFSVIAVRCCIPPRDLILDEPDDQTVPEGGFAFFRVEPVQGPRQPPIPVLWFRNGLPMIGETNPEILIPRVTLALDNSLYSARVGSQFSRAARLLVTPTPPRIVNQPLDEQVVTGRRVSFTSASTSSLSQTLQWQRTASGGADFADIPNETATLLSFVVQSGDDNRRYRMCATNSGGTTCSRGALLTVIAQPTVPVITQQPQPATVPAGSTANFTVLATGGSLSYEWQSSADGGANFTPAAAGAAATFTIPNTALADDGLLLRVRVFNSAGSTLSSNVLLTVRLNPGAALTRVGGAGHSVGLRGNGALRAWGSNSNGELGDGTFVDRNDAVDVVGLGDVATFSVGFGHSLAIRANGEVWAWGRNRDGQLGDGTTANRATPQPVPGLPAARAVAASKESVGAYSLAVLADGTVRAWGDNAYGQLGDGTVTDRLTPVTAGSLSEVVSVAAGRRHSLAVRSDGSLWTWGANQFGQLGDGTTTASLVPRPVSMPAPIVAVSAGTDYSLALTDEGTVLAWGLNLSRVLADATVGQRSTPGIVPLPAPAVAIAAAWDGHALALLLDGRVYAWGANFFGQCGLGTDTVPQQVIAPLPANIVAIGVGANHSLALDSTGMVWAWGNNSGGALNDGTTVRQREAPVPVLNVNLN